MRRDITPWYARKTGFARCTFGWNVTPDRLLFLLGALQDSDDAGVSL
jgi:hypothetical protein